MEAGRRGNIGVGGRHVSLVLALFALFGTVLVLSSSRTVAGVEAASEPPAGADQGGEGEGTGDFHASFTDEHGEHEEEGEVDEATPSTAGGEEVVASDQQGEHEGEGDEPSTGKADDNGIADLLKLMTKDMHIDFAKKQFGQLSSVVKELTDHLHKAHELHPEGEGKKSHPVLKKVFSKRTHDKMVNVLQKMYKDVPREEINEQLHGVMSLIQNLKADPHASTDQLLQKTAAHLGLELTPELFEDMKKHMSWATKLFQKLPLHLLNPQKAEEL